VLTGIPPIILCPSHYCKSDSFCFSLRA